MSKFSALIVDDEPDICELLSLTLNRMEVDTTAVQSMQAALTSLREASFDMCISDMRLPDGDGIELVEYVQKKLPNLPIAIITAHGNMECAIRALKAGAFDFVSKPVDIHVLRSMVNAALKLSVKGATPKPATHELLGDSAAMHEIRAKIGKLARSQAPVYISGESGTGKELVARLMHEKGPRAEFPFVAVNCGAIPEDLMESEFFGHKKGSFTGAVNDKEGLFQAANAGTLFLDEIAELPLHMQVKLLRALQEKSIRPVGSAKEIAIDVRVLSATHENLANLVEDGRFRQDLYYRINVIGLHVPPLRERVSDIPLLARHFLARFIDHPNEEAPQLSTDSMAALASYHFPGNVRELENVLERAITLCEGNTITPEDLQLSSVREIDGSNRGSKANLPGLQLENYLDTIEKEAIVKALEQTGYNKTAAARLLGITFRALRYRLKKLGLD